MLNTYLILNIFQHRKIRINKVPAYFPKLNYNLPPELICGSCFTIIDLCIKLKIEVNIQ